MTTEHTEDTEDTEVATSETDKNCGWALTNHYGRSEGRCLQMDRNGPFVHVDFARQLERERDEARELLASEKITRNYIIKRSVEVERERDEARERSAKLAAQLLAEMEARP